METKSISTSDLKPILSVIWEIHTCRSALTKQFFDDEKGFIDGAPTPFGWAELYSEPLIKLVWSLLATINSEGGLIKDLQSKTSLADVQATLENSNDLSFVDFGDGEKHTKYLFLCIWFALMRSLESIQIYGRSLNRLIEDVAHGNDKALFDAVKLDHTITANKHVHRRIAIAELKKDQKFFTRLANCTKSRPEKHRNYSPCATCSRSLMKLAC